jgi:hypothetical protein
MRNSHLRKRWAIITSGQPAGRRSIALLSEAEEQMPNANRRFVLKASPEGVRLSSVI